MKRLALLLFCPVFCLAVAAGASGGEFQIVVNAGNPVTTIKRPLLRDYFLGLATRWIDGSAVKPLDLPETSPIRMQFSQEILGKDPAAVKSHWMSLLFAGRGTPPPEHDSEQKLLAAVRNTPTAIGYISTSTALGQGVKAIVVTDK